MSARADDVARTLQALRDKRDKARQLADAAPQLLEALQSALDMLERADCSTGYCCCGSKVDSHGMGDGHSPVDEGQYHQHSAIKQARAAIAAATGDQA